MAMAQYLSIEQASEKSGISRYAIRQMVARKVNTLPHLRIGRVIKIDEADLMAHLESMKVRNH